MTIRLQASVQSLVFVIMLAATLFGAAGRIDIIEFWVYIAIIATVSALSLTILDTDLMQERMRPGGHRVGWHFLPLIIVIFLHWAVAGLDRGHLHLSDEVKPGLEVLALVLFALAWIVFVWAMYVNRFFSSIPRIQSERGHTVISGGPYRFVRHPGYTASLLAAATSGIALGSWISTFIAPIALALLVWRTIVEDRMLQRDLPGYDHYAARVPYRLVPGIW
ncbi:MAG: isoprenylcysteine carboxylmethyltransferase family protein [Pseudolabrys sp.]